MQIACERCEKIFEIDRPSDGQKVECPYCGDVNVIRTGTSNAGEVARATPVGPDRAVAAGYPPAHGPEVDVMMVRPAMLGAHPMRFLALFALLVGGLVAAGYFQWSVNANRMAATGSAAAALLGLIGFVAWKIHNLSTGLKITTKRTIEAKGLFSKATSDVLHTDIKNIQIRQTFGQRMMRVGLLAMSSSAENEDEISMEDVPNPERVRFIIDLYRRL